ncbi:M20/M25/M40 family metallo-hydrolase [Qipengyuania sp. GH1]|uniref:M28 family metallopeptidase n=1 Tax=Qipengyuania aestuarii TaxID=2867241 RepID=UPI001C86788E|nr:M20/M25/M40 family metallo-hydrolase [Qipengyuania aestuarii]
MILRSLAASTALILALPAAAQPEEMAGTEIEADRLVQTVRTLASDQFEGRAPGTAGEDRTIGYLIGRLQALGLEPGGENGTWTQKVPLLHTRLGTPERLAFQHDGNTSELSFPTDIYLSTLQPNAAAKIDGAPLVFVGYGVHAPERGWDDFKGVDLKGKVAVFLVNDPDFHAGADEDVAGTFGGRTMTYYGRWTYKFEEAARQGAVGALIVHETAGAGYGWNVIESPGGENYDVVRKPEDLTSLALQGWISGETAKSLFADAGLDLAQLSVAARKDDFRPVDLGTSFSASFPVTSEVVQSQNVLAKISGTKRPEESIVYGAHWDAYGEGQPDELGRIYRAGANDDALGVAGLMEIARAFKAAPAPDRSVVFAFWTAEERGLLGSEFYAANPLYPIEKTVANFDLDILQTAGLAKDVILVGKGQSTLEDDLARFAAAQGRTVSEESLPERGLFFRADHFSMAKRGVPVMLMMGIAGASDLIEGGKEAGQAWVDDYTGRCYHAACDAWSPEWNLAGAVQDIALFRDMGAELANSRRWPEWKAGSEFKAVREESAAVRGE